MGHKEGESLQQSVPVFVVSKHKSFSEKYSENGSNALV